MMRPGIGLERELGFVPRLHLVQLVLVEERDDLPVGFDQRHHRIERQPGDEAARAQLQVDHVAVARRARGRLLEVPLRVLELRADLRDLRVLRRRPCAPSFCCDLLRRRDRLRFGRLRLRLLRCAPLRAGLQLGEVRLRLLEVEAVAGAGRDELAVLLDALAREVQPRVDFARSCAPPAAIARARFDDLGVGAASATPRARAASLARSRAAPRGVDLELVGRRVDAEQHVALLHETVAFLDRHLEHAAPAPARRSAPCT